MISTTQAQAVLADEKLQEELLDDELDELDEPAHIRESRIAALKQQMSTLRVAADNKCGQLDEITEEKALFDLTTSQPRVICHFFHPDFRRCQLMSKHLEQIAPRHFTTKFVRLNGEKAPFLVTKLQVRVLPTVLCFINGVVKDRLVGFEDLGNADNFKTQQLEKRLAKSGVISLATQQEKPQTTSTIFGYGGRNNEDSDTDDE
eukprot:m.20606 g.20606  ORF g.20606 m.20606 type:complete len:204 (+) comp12515_c0_seq2:142-753(+)